MKTPAKVNSMDYVASCVETTQREWDSYMEGTTKANGKTIRSLIKKHLPELYEDLALEFYNPFESQCRKKKGLFVYVHSMIEHFIEYE